MTSIQEDLVKAQTQLARLEAERDRVLQPLEDDLRRARLEGVKGDALAAISERLETRRKLSDHLIGEAQAEVTSLFERGQIQQEAERKQAQEQLATLKADAKEAWLRSGGTPASFDTAWPDMESAILQAKVLDAIAPKSEPRMPAERAALYRNSL